MKESPKEQQVVEEKSQVLEIPPPVTYRIVTRPGPKKMMTPQSHFLIWTPKSLEDLPAIEASICNPAK